jgi:hypothetical protein
VIRTAALSAAGVAAAAGLLATTPSPPPSEPPSASEPSDNSAEFERKLAELAFTLYLGSELDIVPGASSCTEPPSLEVGETITCFTLIDDQRVIVARTELSGTSGVYEFELISDHELGSTDTSPPTTLASTTSGGPTTTLPTPVLITTTVPLSDADRQLLAYGEQVNAEADAFVDTLLEGQDGVIATAEYRWDAPTTTVFLTVALGDSYVGESSTMGWILSRDRAMELWNRDSPFRAAGTTVRPRLVVTVDHAEYVSDFDLSVELADQTIAMDEWIAASEQ